MDQLVIKRDFRLEPFQLVKIQERIEKTMNKEDLRVIDSERLLRTIESGIPHLISTDAIDTFLAETVSSMSCHHPVYDMLAGRIAMGRLRKVTPDTFSRTMDVLWADAPGILSPDIYNIIKANRERLDTAIMQEEDMLYSFSSLKALERTYLLRLGQKAIERPQYMFMRVAVAIHTNDINRVIETYTMMAHRHFIHATPTLIHSGTKTGQLSSCYLLPLCAGTVKETYQTLADCATIGNASGGIGLSVSNVATSNANCNYGTPGGLTPLLRLFDASVGLTNGGGNRRPTAITVYVEPWHSDILTFLSLKSSRGNEALKAKKLFYGLWIPDTFMERVKKNKNWTLFDPRDVPLLNGCHGHEFEHNYLMYEISDINRTTIRAGYLWRRILESQIETGGPFMMYKDAINNKNNQKNLGTITHSNLCTEIMQYSSHEETAVCNLASIGLPTFVQPDKTFNFGKLHDVAMIIVRNLNLIIDSGQQVDAKADLSNQRHRAIGIGIQGLADTFMAMGFPFESTNAKELNLRISQTIYHACLTASNVWARDKGSYSSFKGSPASLGVLQFDMWEVTPPSYGLDWESLRENIIADGLANSLMVALMPTAGTTQITGFSESFEPLHSNVFTRRVLSGESQVICPRLISDLESIGLWSNKMRMQVTAAGGSVQGIEEIPCHIREVYKTVWEISPRTLIDMAVDRAPYVCQSQSLSIYMETPTVEKLSKMHIYGWRRGLKTGMYYLRCRASSQPLPVTLPVSEYPANVQVCTIPTTDQDLESNACTSCTA